MKVISVRDNVGIPKYKQIISSIEQAVLSGALGKNDRLPSINKVCMEFNLSRDTVLLAYEQLKKRGIVSAIPGKGYYIKSLEVTIREKIFLLFDELNSFKEDIYMSFLENIGNDVQVDIYFHHFNIEMFRKLIGESNGNYTKYIIMPTNLAGSADVIGTLPIGEVIILDQTNPDLARYPAVYQNFVTDIYQALQKGKELMEKYAKLILIFPGFREPLGMKEGFSRFCSDHRMTNEIIPEFLNREIEYGDVFIIPNDRDLVRVIEQSKRQRLNLGSDFGIISYNETPLKKVVENGITTISTDFSAMGKLLADMVLTGKKRQIENQSRLIIRSSL